jgi:hypothetical protein
MKIKEGTICVRTKEGWGVEIGSTGFIFKALKPNIGFEHRARYGNSSSINPEDFRLATPEEIKYFEANTHIKNISEIPKINKKHTFTNQHGFLFIENNVYFYDNHLIIRFGHENTYNNPTVRTRLEYRWFEQYDRWSFCLEDVKKATPEQIAHLEACEKAGKYVEPLKIISKALILEDIVVNVTTQEEWDKVTEMQKIKWRYGEWRKYKTDSCIHLKSRLDLTYGSKNDCEKCKTILTFQEYLNLYNNQNKTNHGKNANSNNSKSSQSIDSSSIDGSRDGGISPTESKQEHRRLRKSFTESYRRQGERIKETSRRRRG